MTTLYSRTKTEILSLNVFNMFCVVLHCVATLCGHDRREIVKHALYCMPQQLEIHLKSLYCKLCNNGSLLHSCATYVAVAYNEYFANSLFML